MPHLNLLCDVPGLLVGHATDLALGSGVTAVLFEQPAVASGLVLGGAPGGRDTALLDPAMTVETVDALVLSGGSAFGLDAASGVMAALREDGRGFPVGRARVPIVPQAILMDLNHAGNKDWGRFPPYRELGYAAARAATGGAFALGSVGAGTGTTTATAKGGLGSASAATAAGHTVAALVAVNAIGSALVGTGPHFWAAPFEVAAEFGGLGWPAAMDTAPRIKGMGGPGTTPPGATTLGTTIGVVATDAVLSKAQAHRLAVAAHDGLARAVQPAHLALDGDTMFAASTGRRALDAAAAEFTALCHEAARVTARAIARGVYAATGFPGAKPAAWRDLFGAG